jgi:hypothetical protein
MIGHFIAARIPGTDLLAFFESLLIEGKLDSELKHNHVVHFTFITYKVNTQK